MKLETASVIAKAACYVLIGAGTPFVASLSQWANDDASPSALHWVLMISGAVLGGATQLLSFLSGSYADYKQSRLAAKSPDPAPATIPDNRPG